MIVKSSHSPQTPPYCHRPSFVKTQRKFSREIFSFRQERPRRKKCLLQRNTQGTWYRVSQNTRGTWQYHSKARKISKGTSKHHFAIMHFFLGHPVFRNTRKQKFTVAFIKYFQTEHVLNLVFVELVFVIFIIWILCMIYLYNSALQLARQFSTAVTTTAMRSCSKCVVQ